MNERCSVDDRNVTRLPNDGELQSEVLTVAAALKSFEEKLGEGESLKVIDYIRLLEGMGATPVEPAARMTLQWADIWTSTIADEK